VKEHVDAARRIADCRLQRSQMRAPIVGVAGTEGHTIDGAIFFPPINAAMLAALRPRAQRSS
jgi:hypothetical protein